MQAYRGCTRKRLLNGFNSSSSGGGGWLLMDINQVLLYFNRYWTNWRYCLGDRGIPMVTTDETVVMVMLLGSTKIATTVAIFAQTLKASLTWYIPAASSPQGRPGGRQHGREIVFIVIVYSCCIPSYGVTYDANKWLDNGAVVVTHDCH